MDVTSEIELHQSAVRGVILQNELGLFLGRKAGDGNFDFGETRFGSLANWLAGRNGIGGIRQRSAVKAVRPSLEFRDIEIGFKLREPHWINAFFEAHGGGLDYKRRLGGTCDAIQASSGHIVHYAIERQTFALGQCPELSAVVGVESECCPH